MSTYTLALPDGMHARYNARFDNALYRVAQMAVHFATKTKCEEIRVLNHLLDLSEWLAGVGAHPDCPACYRRHLERVARLLPVYRHLLGSDRWDQFIAPFLARFV